MSGIFRARPRRRPSGRRARSRSCTPGSAGLGETAIFRPKPPADERPGRRETIGARHPALSIPRQCALIGISRSPGQGREPAEPGADEADRRAVHGDAVPRQPPDGEAPAQPGPLRSGGRWPGWVRGPSTSGRARLCLTRSTASIRLCSGVCRSTGQTTSGARISPAFRCGGRDHGLGDTPDAGTAHLEHHGRRVSYRGTGRCSSAPGDRIRHGPRQPIHQPVVHASPAGCGGEGLGGQPRAGWTTLRSSGHGGPRNTNASACTPSKQGPRHGRTSAGGSTFTPPSAHIPRSADEPRSRPTRAPVRRRRHDQQASVAAPPTCPGTGDHLSRILDRRQLPPLGDGLWIDP